MGFFLVRYDSRVVIYDCRAFMRLATDSFLKALLGFCCTPPIHVFLFHNSWTAFCHATQCSVAHVSNIIFTKLANLGLFFRLISVVSFKYYNLTTNKCEKCSSSIWCWDTNSQPSDYESPPLTTSGLPSIIKYCLSWLPNLFADKIHDTFRIGNFTPDYYCHYPNVKILNLSLVNFIVHSGP